MFIYIYMVSIYIYIDVFTCRYTCLFFIYALYRLEKIHPHMSLFRHLSTETEVWNLFKTPNLRGAFGCPSCLVYQPLFECDTVDGQNPAPPRMMIIPSFIGF